MSREAVDAAGVASIRKAVLAAWLVVLLGGVAESFVEDPHVYWRLLWLAAMVASAAYLATRECPS